MDNVVDCEQNTPEWHQARCGSLGASSVAEALAKTKSGWGAGRKNTKARLVAERLTGSSPETYTNAAMQWGNDHEDDARVNYGFAQNVDVAQIGLVRHPTINGTHASPDGLVGDDGLVEIKCPNTATHIDTLLSQKINTKYITQMQWQMACTGRQWCDFVSYDPRMPIAMQIWICRIDRDDDAIAALEKDVGEFLAEVNETVEKLSKLYDMAA